MSGIYSIILPKYSTLSFIAYYANIAFFSALMISLLIWFIRTKKTRDTKKRFVDHIWSLWGALLLLSMILPIYPMSPKAIPTIEISDRYLRVGYLVTSLRSLERDKLALIDLQKRPDLVKVEEISGSDYGGLLNGWYKLKNGRKAYLAITDQSRVVYIPTKDFDLLLSVENGEEMVRTLVSRG